MFEREIIEVNILTRKKRQFDDGILKEAKNLNSTESIALFYNKVYSYWSNKVLQQLVENNADFKREIEELTESIARFNQTCSESIRDFFFKDLFDLKALNLNIFTWSWKQSPLASIVSAMILILKFIDDRIASNYAKKHGIRVNVYHKFICPTLLVFLTKCFGGENTRYPADQKDIKLVIGPDGAPLPNDAETSPQRRRAAAGSPRSPTLSTGKQPGFLTLCFNFLKSKEMRELFGKSLSQFIHSLKILIRDE